MGQRTPAKLNKNLGYYLRVYRAAHDMTQAELARELGIGPAHLSLMESGKRYPSRDLIVKIRRLTGAPVYALLGSDERPS